MQVRRVINDVFYSNTFILISELNDNAWIIDPGDIDKIVDLNSATL